MKQKYPDYTKDILSQGVVLVNKKNASLKTAFLITCIFFLLPFQFLQAGAGVPHYLYGSVTIPGYGFPANGTVEFDCYLADYPDDVLHINSAVGNDYQDGTYMVQCSNFEVAWMEGMIIHIDIRDSSGGSASAETVLTNNVSDTLSLILLGSSLAPDHVKLSCKVFIDGGYQSGTGTMTTILNDQGVIPLQSPYADHRTASSIPSGIVDWVYIELRTSPAADPSASRSFFLKNDGMVVDTDGTTSVLQIDGTDAGYYYMVVNHRNHMKIMSADSLFLSP